MFRITKVGLLALYASAVLAGCSSASGPTYSAYDVALPGGQQAYKVTCTGLLEGRNTCERKAEEICKGTPVRVLEGVAPLGSTSGNVPSTREMTFQCGTPQQSVAAPAPAPVPAPVPVPKAISLSGDANFDTGKATLRPGAMDRMDTLANDAKGVTFNKVTVSGYTDSTGSDVLNQSLSEHRAQAVADYLRGRGLEANSWVVHGYGKTAPVASNATAAGRAENRRVKVSMN